MASRDEALWEAGESTRAQHSPDVTSNQPLEGTVKDNQHVREYAAFRERV